MKKIFASSAVTDDDKVKLGRKGDAAQAKAWVDKYEAARGRASDRASVALEDAERNLAVSCCVMYHAACRAVRAPSHFLATPHFLATLEGTKHVLVSTSYTSVLSPTTLGPYTGIVRCTPVIYRCIPGPEFSYPVKRQPQRRVQPTRGHNTTLATAATSGWAPPVTAGCPPVRRGQTGTTAP